MGWGHKVDKSETFSASCSLYSREGGSKKAVKRVAIEKGLGGREFSVLLGLGEG